MSPTEIVQVVVTALDRMQVPYMVTGSIANSAYGITRGTKDLDIVIELVGHSVPDLVRSFGPEFVLEPQVRFESITGTTCFRIRVKKSRFFVELFALDDDAFSRQRFQRRTSVNLYGLVMSFPTPEDALIQKFRWWILGGRDQDRIDAVDIIQTMQDQLDWKYVQHWSELHGTWKEIERVRGLGK